MLSDRETKGLTVLNSMTGRDVSCLWNCYSLSAQREFIEVLQEFSKNFQRSNESDWSVPRPGDITVCFQVSLCLGMLKFEFCTCTVKKPEEEKCPNIFD